MHGPYKKGTLDTSGHHNHFFTSALQTSAADSNCCFLCHARYQLFLGSSKFVVLLLLHFHVICVWLWMMSPAVFLEEVLHTKLATRMLKSRDVYDLSSATDNHTLTFGMWSATKTFPCSVAAPFCSAGTKVASTHGIN